MTVPGSFSMPWLRGKKGPSFDVLEYLSENIEAEFVSSG